MKVHKRHRPIKNLGRSLNASPTAGALTQYGHGEGTSPPASLTDPYSEQEDPDDYHGYDMNEDSVISGGHSINNLDDNNTIPAGSSGLSKMYSDKDKLRTTSAVGLSTFSDYDSSTDILTEKSFSRRANTISCTRANTISGNNFIKHEGNIESQINEFQNAENNSINPKQSMTVIRNFKNPGTLQSSLRNSYPLNFNNSIYGEEPSCSTGGIYNSSRRNLTSRSSLVGALHDRKKTSMGTRREDVKKTRKQVKLLKLVLREGLLYRTLFI